MAAYFELSWFYITTDAKCTTKYYEILPAHTEKPHNTTGKIANRYVELRSATFWHCKIRSRLLLNQEPLPRPMLTLIYVAVWYQWVPMIWCYPLDPMYYLPDYLYDISTVWLAQILISVNLKKDNTGQWLITYSIVFVCYRPTITHENSPLFCIICSALSVLCMHPHIILFFVSLQMTLLIHVNSMTAFNASHFLNSETWHMISIIGHQRRLTSVTLRRLTPENCHQSIITALIHCLQEYCYPLRHEWPDEHLFHLQ